MVMKLVRKSKVEKSPHFEEIVTRLSKGDSARSVSKWLMNQYNEDISHAALARYRKNCISMEERVEAELNRRAEERKKKAAEEQKEHKIEQKIQQEAENLADTEETVNTVAETIADNMSKVAEVAANFIDDYERAKHEADDPEIPKVTYKDVANLSLRANKIYAEYFKQEGTNVEVNVNKEVTVNLLERVKEKRKELNDLNSNRTDSNTSRTNKSSGD